MEFEVKKTGYDTYYVGLSDKTKKKLKKVAVLAMYGAAIGYSVGTVYNAYNDTKKKPNKK